MMTDWYSLTREELSALMEELGEKPFRGRQIFKWLHAKKAVSFAEMTDLPALLREKLSEIGEARRGGLDAVGPRTPVLFDEETGRRAVGRSRGCDIEQGHYHRNGDSNCKIIPFAQTDKDDILDTEGVSSVFLGCRRTGRSLSRRILYIVH